MSLVTPPNSNGWTIPLITDVNDNGDNISLVFLTGERFIDYVTGDKHEVASFRVSNRILREN